MTKLATLRHDDGVHLRPEPLIALYAELGDLAADRAVCRALGDIAARVADMRRLAEAAMPQGRAALIRCGRALARAATGLGMVTLAQVAQDVVAAALAGDAAARAATLARLERVGDRSLHAIWDLQDVTGTPG